MADAVVRPRKRPVAAPITPGQRLLTPAQARAMLGYKSNEPLMRLRRSRAIKTIGEGRGLRYDLRDIELWLAINKWQRK